MKRINAIIKYIKSEDRVIDVGCDHAYLSMILSKKRIFSIASDLKENIIQKAHLVASTRKLDDYIDFRCGNGFDTLRKEDNINVAVLSGMGSYLIIKLLSNTNYKFEKIITISNREHEYLRKNMLKLGYTVSLEEIIYEKGKYYNLILFKEGKTKYTIDELIIGKNHQNLEMLDKKNKEELIKINNILNTINNDKLLQKKKVIERNLISKFQEK